MLIIYIYIYTQTHTHTHTPTHTHTHTEFRSDQNDRSISLLIAMQLASKIIYFEIFWDYISLLKPLINLLTLNNASFADWNRCVTNKFSTFWPFGVILNILQFKRFTLEIKIKHMQNLASILWHFFLCQYACICCQNVLLWCRFIDILGLNCKILIKINYWYWRC